MKRDDLERNSNPVSLQHLHTPGQSLWELDVIVVLSVFKHQDFCVVIDIDYLYFSLYCILWSDMFGLSNVNT